MNHILLGASFPFVVALIIYLFKGRRAPFSMLIITPVCMLLGLLWAVAPDIPRAIGFYDFYKRIEFDQRCDICLWHYTIDRIETHSEWCGVVFVFMILAMLFAAWRELHLAEKET